MLSDHERQELVGLVAKECGTVLSPDDPIFASVVMSERVLEHAASAVASRLARTPRGVVCGATRQGRAHGRRGGQRRAPSPDRRGGKGPRRA